MTIAILSSLLIASLCANGAMLMKLIEAQNRAAQAEKEKDELRTMNTKLQQQNANSESRIVQAEKKVAKFQAEPPKIVPGRGCY